MMLLAWGGVAMVTRRADVDAPLVLFPDVDSKNVPPIRGPTTRRSGSQDGHSRAAAAKTRPISGRRVPKLFIHASRDMSVMR